MTPSGDVGNFVWVWDAWSSGRSVCFLRSLDLYFSFGNDVFLFSSLFGSEGAQKHNSICSQIRFWDQHVLQLFFPGIKRVIPHDTNQDVDNDGGKIYVYLARNPDKRNRTNRPLATNECHPWRFAPTVLMFGTLDPTKLIDIDIEFPNGPRIGKTKDNILISRGRTWPYCLCGICFTIKCFGKVDGSPPLVIQWKVVIPPA